MCEGTLRLVPALAIGCKSSTGKRQGRKEGKGGRVKPLALWNPLEKTKKRTQDRKGAPPLLHAAVCQLGRDTAAAPRPAAAKHGQPIGAKLQQRGRCGRECGSDGCLG